MTDPHSGTLTTEEAVELSRSSSNCLHLEKLSRLSPEISHLLSQFRGSALVYSGLTSLSEDTAQALCQFQGPWHATDIRKQVWRNTFVGCRRVSIEIAENKIARGFHR